MGRRLVRKPGARQFADERRARTLTRARRGRAALVRKTCCVMLQEWVVGRGSAVLQPRSPRRKTGSSKKNSCRERSAPTESRSEIQGSADLSRKLLKFRGVSIAGWDSGWSTAGQRSNCRLRLAPRCYQTLGTSDSSSTSERSVPLLLCVSA